MTGRVQCLPEPDGVYILRLSNPARKNALDDTMIGQIQDALDRLSLDPACRVLVFEGDGADFCAGRDIAQFDPEAFAPDALRPTFAPLGVLLDSIRSFPRPVVSIVRGYCLGLGAAIVCMSDLAFASADARIGFPEAKVGISPSFTAVALVQSVGLKAAMQLLLSAQAIDGRRAERIGLVTESVPDAGLENLARANIAAIVRTSPSANALCKKLVYSSRQCDFDTALELALDCTVAAALTDDAREGRAAFREKRRPRWLAATTEQAHD